MTLIEYLLAIAIVAVIVALLLPNPQSAKPSPGRDTSRNNLKQIGLAFHNYHDQHLQLPAGGVYAGNVGQHGWMSTLLPGLGQAPLYNQINFSLPYNDPVNAPVFGQTVRDFINPRITLNSNTNMLARAHYTANVRLLSKNSTTRFVDITDGLTVTILAGDIIHNPPAWGAPDNFRDPALGINRQPHGFGSPFKGGSHVLLADGAVRFLSENISPETLKRLADPADGQSVGDF